MKCSNKEVLGPGVCFSFLAQLCVNHRLWNSYLLSSLAGFLEWTSGNRHVVFLSLALYCAALLRQREILCHKTNTPLLNSANTSDHNSLSIFLSFLPSLCTCFLFQYHHFSMETTACRSCDTVCVCELSHVIGYWTRNWKKILLWGIDYLLQPAENSGSVRLPDVHVISFSASFCSRWVLWRVSFLRPTFSNKQHSKLTLNSAGSLISRYLWPKLVLRYSSVCFSAGSFCAVGGLRIVTICKSALVASKPRLS